MKRTRILVLGAGGFAREVKWLIEDLAQAGEPCTFAGYAVSDLSRLGDHDSRDEVRGDLSWVLAQRDQFDGLAIGIGDPGVRLKLANDLSTLGPELWPPLIHPSVRLDRRSCRIGHGVLLCAGVIATVNVVFEPFAMVNLSCTLGHEAVIGRGAVLNPTVNVSGGVVLEEGALVGTGAQILQYVRVGRAAVVGAGAVVTKHVPAGQTWTGVPARPLVRKDIA